MTPNPEARRPDHVSGLEFSPKSSHLDGVIPMERLTCANHADEEMILDEIGWNVFVCPKCGHDYSIGRRIVAVKPRVISSYHEYTLAHAMEGIC